MRLPGFSERRSCRGDKWFFPWMVCIPIRFLAYRNKRGGPETGGAFELGVFICLPLVFNVLTKGLSVYMSVVGGRE